MQGAGDPFRGVRAEPRVVAVSVAMAMAVAVAVPFPATLAFLHGACLPGFEHVLPVVAVGVEPFPSFRAQALKRRGVQTLSAQRVESLAQAFHAIPVASGQLAL